MTISNDGPPFTVDPVGPADPTHPTPLAGRAPTPSVDDGRSEPSAAQIVRHLRAANAVAGLAMAAGHHPFGAVLVAPDHETVLIEQGNLDTVNHAESVLARRAARLYPPDQLWGCTLYTTFEPCCMCAGTQYWAHIGRLVYGVSESRLLELTGNHDENPTLDLPCRQVFAQGQKSVRVIGPVPTVEAEIVAPHLAFWRAAGSGSGRV